MVIKVGAAQVDVAQVGAAQVGVAQVGADQAGARQVGVAQGGAAQVGVVEVGTYPRVSDPPRIPRLDAHGERIAAIQPVDSTDGMQHSHRLLVSPDPLQPSSIPLYECGRKIGEDG
jgi:hypothetical protein